MTATAAQIAEVRRMVAEPTTTTYSDDLIESFIARYPLMDEQGNVPYTYEWVDGVYTPVENDLWVATYDLNAAAADIWQEKMASMATRTDFSDAGANYSDNQLFANAQRMLNFFRSRRSMRTIKMIKWPPESGSENNNELHN